MSSLKLGPFPYLSTIALLGAFLSPIQGYKVTCKSTPNDASWPSISQWISLNDSLSGRLLHPSPPALACHSSEPGSNDSCLSVQSSWKTFAFHQDDPISTVWNNMNNDSCLPTASAPCSGIGYPVYVVNATSASHVKLAIDFARENNVRLNVKASGHDYIKRSATPFSLSIWTRYMIGAYEHHETFNPKGCEITINTTAVTAGAGSSVKDVYTNLEEYNLTVVDGLGPEVTMGGYLTGGGHSPISNIFGLGADQLYEVEMVTPTGEIVTANECQNVDLFWAVRGGGGGTFGVLTKVTVRTVPSTPIATFDLTLEAKPDSGAYWDAVAYLTAQFPTLAESNVAAYVYLYPNTSAAGREGDVASFEAIFALYDPPSASALEEILAPHVHHVNKTYSGQVITKVKSTILPDFESLFQQYADDSGAGVDKVVGSRLLPPEVLQEKAFRTALKEFAGPAGARLYMVAGPGVWNAIPRGGSDAVNPAWRKALIHAVTSQNWTPLDGSERSIVEHSIDKIQVGALRRLVPDSGAYLNEVCLSKTYLRMETDSLMWTKAYLKEPDFQQAFWGSNYERLLRIKKVVDPDDVFWCQVCVGSEEWEEVGDRLCRLH